MKRTVKISASLGLPAPHQPTHIAARGVFFQHHAQTYSTKPAVKTPNHDLSPCQVPLGRSGNKEKNLMRRKFNLNTRKTINLSCFDATGKYLWTKTVPVHAGENQLSLNAPRWSGTYTLVVSGSDGIIKTIQAIVH